MRREFTERSHCMTPEIVPAWYGMAYRYQNRAVAVFYPIPLNLIVGWLRRVWIWCRCASSDKQIRSYQEGYEVGRRDGMRENQEQRLERLLDRMEQNISFWRLTQEGEQGACE